GLSNEHKLQRRMFIDTEDAKLKQEREAAEKASESTGVVSKPMETTKKRRTKNYEQTLDDFWGIVDKKLESYRTQVSDTAIRFEVYKGIYDDDVKLFPRDSSLGADLVVCEKDVEPWILSIQARKQSQEILRISENYHRSCLPQVSLNWTVGPVSNILNDECLNDIETSILPAAWCSLQAYNLMVESIKKEQ
ncbi:hypothetical protein F5876DRAFT_71053, partial [Lentinula aff. lateritia]